MIVRSDQIAEFFKESRYEPLLATQPPVSIENKLMTDGPPLARRIVNTIVRSVKVQDPSDKELAWKLWLNSFRREGASDDVQVALAALLFVQHEYRHHIDFYSTTLGPTLVMKLCGEYGALWDLCQPRTDKRSAEHVIRRLRRSQVKWNHLVGVVRHFDPNEWEERPELERETRGGVVRWRKSVADPTDAIVTLAPQGGPERALSGNGLLEMRALIETGAHMCMMLDVVGASEAEQKDAANLLAAIGIDDTTDDYKSVLSLALGQPAVDRIADANRVREFTQDAYNAGWLALHPDDPLQIGAPQKSPDVEDQPCLRFVVAMNLIERVKTPEGQRAQWSEQVFELLEREIQGPQGPNLRRLLSGCLQDMQLLAQPKFPPSLKPHHTSSLSFLVHTSGPAADHVRHLATVAARNLGRRIKMGPKWGDEFNWPPNNDPRLIETGFAECPSTVREAFRTLEFIRGLLRHQSPDGDRLVRQAEKLFT